MSSSIAMFVIVMVLLCTGTYVQYTTTVTSTTYVVPKMVHLPPVLPTVIPAACKNVDFRWLGSDRRFWDGWVSKAMFMKRNGQFTRKNVRIQAGETICITVLLGPIPAVASNGLHYASSDSIVMTARGEKTQIPITLDQHPTQTNAYFAAVTFHLQDIYTLQTSVEYRSYFWEQPHFHQYLPNRFSSRNSLTVTQAAAEEEQAEANASASANGQKCDLLHHPFQWKHVAAWVDDEQFVPPCYLDDTTDVLRQKVIHVWGQEHIRRNLQFLDGDSTCNDEDLGLPTTLLGGDTAIYFGEENSGQGVADIVLLGTGNEGWRQTPNEFAAAFTASLNKLLNVYTGQELIVVKTNRYVDSFHAGVTAGKSLAFANIIRSTLLEFNQTRVVLWDTHQIGVDQPCLVTPVENAMLLNIIQHYYRDNMHKEIKSRGFM